jgi:hypothetical protein
MALLIGGPFCLYACDILKMQRGCFWLQLHEWATTAQMDSQIYFRLLASKKYMYKENNKAIHQGIIEEAMKI